MGTSGILRRLGLSLSAPLWQHTINTRIQANIISTGMPLSRYVGNYCIWSHMTYLNLIGGPILIVTIRIFCDASIGIFEFTTHDYFALRLATKWPESSLNKLFPSIWTSSIVKREFSAKSDEHAENGDNLLLACASARQHRLKLDSDELQAQFPG